VSRNGSCSWQILYMNQGMKSYVCTIDNMIKAAILYDIFCIQMKGMNSRTNFNYTIREINAILHLPNLISIKQKVVEMKQESKEIAAKCHKSHNS
jgi:hypothetical protein